MRIWPLLLMLLVVGPGLAQESKPAWQEVTKQPEWVERKPQRVGFRRFVVIHNDKVAARAKAASANQSALNVTAAIVFDLKKAIGDDAAKGCGAAAAKGMVLLRRAFRTREGRSTAWSLWEVPLETILTAAPPDKRRKANAALVKWVEKQPKWADSPPARKGYYRFVLVRRSNLLRLAKGRADSLATGDARKRIAALLEPALGDDAGAAAAVAERTMVMVGRAAHYQPEPPGPPGSKPTPGGSLATAWTMWEIRVSTVLAHVKDAAKRAAAEKALAQK